MKKTIVWLVAIVFYSATLFAQEPNKAIYEQKSFTVSPTQVLPYRILYPENYDRNKKYPLILFLHGSGERGNDNEKQLTHGWKLFLTEENRKKYPAIIVFPQCPENSYWSAVKVDRTKQPVQFEWDYSLEPTWPLKAANDLVQQIIAEGSVNKRKVYITGLSMGGMGTFESVYRYPGVYAAAMPICGGAQVEAYDERVKKTAFRVLHGDADAVVSVKYSRDMVAKLQSLKARVEYIEYPGVNHNSWDNAFKEPTYMSWLMKHKGKRK